MLHRMLDKVLRREARPVEGGDPFLISIGSLRDCSRKDALAYARGLAERHVTSPELAYYAVLDDKDNSRYLYEVHEGGPGYSILASVREALREGRPVRLALANGGFVTVQDELGELYSLIYKDRDEATLRGAGDDEGQGLQNVHEFCGKKRLSPVFPENRKLPVVGSIALILSFSVFMVTGAAFVLVKSGVLDTDPLLLMARRGTAGSEQDNPVWQLEKARQEAAKQSKALRFLKKDASGWKWELQ